MPDNDLLRALIEQHERGKKMRAKQKEYFKSRTTEALVMSKDIEAKYDRNAITIDNLLKN